MIKSLLKINKKESPTVDSTFLSSYYQIHNVARLSHLEKLELPLNDKTVIEFGAGVGDHTLFYLFKNCKVLPTEGRQELCDFISKRFNIETRKVDIENEISEIKNLPKVDVVHCYGILYHIQNPEQFLEASSSLAKLYLLETCVSDDTLPEGIHLTGEESKDPTQAMSGKGCRPSRSWLYKKLKSLFPYVYVPIIQPRHKDFPLDWNNAMDAKVNKRAIFIGSTEELNSKWLSTDLPKIYQAY